jgi:hypothetical protein
MGSNIAALVVNEWWKEGRGKRPVRNFNEPAGKNSHGDEVYMKEYGRMIFTILDKKELWGRRRQRFQTNLRSRNRKRLSRAPKCQGRQSAMSWRYFFCKMRASFVTQSFLHSSFIYSGQLTPYQLFFILVIVHYRIFCEPYYDLYCDYDLGHLLLVLIKVILSKVDG